MMTVRSCLALLLTALTAAACGDDGGDHLDAAPGPDAGAPPDAAPACAPSASCQGAVEVAACLALEDNSDLGSFTLRMAELRISTPTPLTVGIVGHVVSSSVTPALPSCNLGGTATTSWLLTFAPGVHMFTTAGAAPVADPTQGYRYPDTIIAGFQVQPASASLTIDGGSASVGVVPALNLPIYLDSAGTRAVILPLREVTFGALPLTSGNSCIGSYNAAGLDPDSGCVPDADHPAFLAGGHVDAFITLEDADADIVDTLGESLCVLLSGDATTFGDQGSPARCKRDAAGHVVLPGDWCSMTNAAGGCADALRLSADFAASGVRLATP